MSAADGKGSTPPVPPEGTEASGVAGDSESGRDIGAANAPGRAARASRPRNGYKKLPGLWGFCVLLGIVGLVSLALGVHTARGGQARAAIVIWGVATGPGLTGAVGLWARSNVVRIAMMLYFGLLMLASVPAALVFALQGFGTGLVLVGALSCICLVCWWGLEDARPYFVVPEEQKPGIWSLAALVALAVVLGVGLVAVVSAAVSPIRTAYAFPASMWRNHDEVNANSTAGWTYTRGADGDRQVEENQEYGANRDRAVTAVSRGTDDPGH